MLIRTISLVILLKLTCVSSVYSVEKNKFIYPKIKPSVFKQINLKKELLPQTKPIIKKKLVFKKKELVKPIEKPLLKNKTTQKNKANVKKEIIKEKIKIKKNTFLVTSDTFLYPKKKPASYKTTLKIKEKSSILNQKDFEKAKVVFDFIRSKKWNSALKTTTKVKDKEFRDLVKWLYLLETGNSASFNDYKNFIEKNSDYPRIGRLRYLAEHKIYLKNNSPTAIINWFNKYPPVSGMGKIKLSEAYLDQGKTEEVKSIIKDGWITADIRKNDLGYYRAKFKSFIKTDEHIKRADYLAWNKKYWDLKRMLRYLPKEIRTVYNARQILMSNSYGVDKAIEAVPQKFKENVGLQYDRLKWRNRRGRTEQSLEILYSLGIQSEEFLVRSDLWWKERKSLARSLIYKKRYKTAYKITSEHSLKSGANFAEAEWLSGWISLSFLNSPEYAITHFENFYNNVNYPISLARGAYWLGRAYKDVGNEKDSKKYFKEGSKYLTTYYGQLSFNEINFGGEFKLKDETGFSKEYEKEFNKNRLIKHIILLNELDATKYGKSILKHLAKLNIEEGSEVLAAKLATEVERYDFAIQISKEASYEKRFFLQYNYPIITTPRVINNKEMPNSELILAIIRQESEFDRKANSYVGAKGMMQLMKYTAKVVAKQAKLPYSISGLTKNPEYNIKLGSYYFDSLLKQYDGVYPFAIAAYNAGPKRVNTWKKKHGDPNKNEIDYVNWIELIRFKETRNYVQRVLENVNVYKYMINKAPVNINNYYK